MRDTKTKASSPYDYELAEEGTRLPRSSGFLKGKIDKMAESIKIRLDNHYGVKRPKPVRQTRIFSDFKAIDQLTRASGLLYKHNIGPASCITNGIELRDLYTRSGPKILGHGGPRT